MGVSRVDPNGQLIELIYKLKPEGEQDWEFKLWSYIKDGLRSYFESGVQIEGFDCCEVSDLRRLVKLSNRWVLNGELVKLGDWDLKYREWSCR